MYYIKDVPIKDDLSFCVVQVAPMHVNAPIATYLFINRVVDLYNVVST